jgi:hypothetical protein
MERMGGVSVIKELNGDNIHRLQNVMTLDTSIHHMFDHLYLWFEATVCTILLVWYNYE